MSDLICRVQAIESVLPHPNADKLEIAIVGGWQVVIAKDSLKMGDDVIHIPPDAMVPKNIAEEWGVATYLSFNSNSENGRVRAIKLRGEPMTFLSTDYI